MKNKLVLYPLLLVVLLITANCLGQDQAAAAATDADAVSLWATIAKGGIIGYMIICMSLCTVALIIEHFLSLRHSVLLPEDHVDTLADFVKKGDYKQAVGLCNDNDNFLTRIMASGLNQCQVGLGYQDVEKSAEEAARREAGRLYRKLEYLSFIAASAPMLGLLGTVTGMISAFNHIAAIDGAARSSQLASAISQALITTCLGLIVAIPALFFLSVFRNRIEGILTDAEVTIESILRPLKLASLKK